MEENRDDDVVARGPETDLTDIRLDARLGVVGSLALGCRGVVNGLPRLDVVDVVRNLERSGRAGGAARLPLAATLALGAIFAILDGVEATLDGRRIAVLFTTRVTSLVLSLPISDSSAQVCSRRVFSTLTRSSSPTCANAIRRRFIASAQYDIRPRSC